MTDLLEISRLLAEHSACDIEEITPDKSLVGDLGLDSFSLLDAALAFEDHFHIAIPDSDLHLLNTVQDVVDYINTHTKE
ncbi:MAG: Acyl carrier protein [Desulfovibrio sp.]|uniref:acyl carrier protein n=1 Tax=Christensenella intestinihominis TaxID=1851429 RepID=UPI0008302F8A|nr:acyl carrier protein [Christensenella intestinihominis]